MIILSEYMNVWGLFAVFGDVYFMISDLECNII